jgi:hypothetical protein
MIQQFVSFVGAGTRYSISATLGSLGGYVTMELTNMTSATVGTTRVIQMLDMPTSIVKCPIEYVQQSPGWSNASPILVDRTTPWTTTAGWEGTMMAMRKAVYESICGCNTITYASTLYSSIKYQTDARQYTTPLICGVKVSHDAIALFLENGGTGDAPNLVSGAPNSGGPALAIIAPTIAVDTSPIVAALTDLLNRDVMTQLNNGAVTVLGWSGDVIENP